jgi:hypothetical protein
LRGRGARAALGNGSVAVTVGESSDSTDDRSGGAPRCIIGHPPALPHDSGRPALAPRTNTRRKPAPSFDGAWDSTPKIAGAAHTARAPARRSIHTPSTPCQVPDRAAERIRRGS